MMMALGNKPKMWRKSNRLGEVIRAGVGSVMIKLSKYTPNPLAPSYMVDRLGGFFLVGSRFIRCVYTTDNVERVNLIWDNTVVHGESDIYRSIIEEIRRGTFRSDGWHGVQ